MGAACSLYNSHVHHNILALDLRANGINVQQQSSPPHQTSNPSSSTAASSGADSVLVSLQPPEELRDKSTGEHVKVVPFTV
jgi:hypothetical protein